MDGILSAIIIGAIVGLLARAFTPGRQAIGVLWTILIGVAGAVIGNFIGEAISPDGTMHWILSVIVAVGLLIAYVAMSRGRAA